MDSASAPRPAPFWLRTANMVQKTRWGIVFLIICAGIIAAFQVGKAAIAVPALRDDLSISLVFASWIVGAAAGNAQPLAARSMAVATATERNTFFMTGLRTRACLAGAARPRRSPTPRRR